jgi:hypothetical protein
MAFGLPDPLASIESTVGSAALKVGEGLKNTVVGTVKQGINDFVNDTGFGKALRAVNLLANGMPQEISFTDGVWGSGNDNDWRVRLSIPSSFKGSPIITPLLETNGLTWPYTPQIMIEHSASYNTLTPIHSNYPYYAYQNSQVNNLTVMGDFLIENATEGEYWLAAVHYLRSVTKMAYGNTSNQGSPPPVVKLNGYGDYVFKNVPVIVQSFTVELPADVDYIQVGIGANGAWVPTKSSISAMLTPIYSRRDVSKFSLDAFVRGDYVINGKGFI